MSRSPAIIVVVMKCERRKVEIQQDFVKLFTIKDDFFTISEIVWHWPVCPIISLINTLDYPTTFFPTSELDEDEGYLEEDLHKEEKFDFFTEFLRLTVDLVDLVGIYLALQRIAGKGQVKIMIAGVGWAFAELFLTRVIFLWVGARGIEFDWKYILKSFDANISLVHFITLSCLIWLWMRRDIPKSVIPVIIGLLVISSYKTLILDTFVHSFGLGIWTALAYKAIVTLCIGLITLQLYVGITANDLY
ncbi:Transmembrane protein 147 [Lepeophtheirus salmonis]|uniref:BOS complex subunit TMEM147 n=1 Tax=Lepeophtheirus salmonis TaxID=72036 RepID=A0A7R8H5M8_LEPSM|nr:Transmembrane protein 147 [Lepeophtheirus salmonis]CAF2866512.1 Transmembrane protein 147 [Lepeophtheirus salmonis]